MKILMTLFTRRYEGTFYRALPWANFLAARRHEVTILCTSENHFRTTVSVENGVRIIETPALFSGRCVMTRLCGMYGWGPLDILARCREIVRGRYDVVHAFEHHMNVALPVYLAGRKRVPVLVADWCDHYGKGGLREYEYSPYRLYRLYKVLGFLFERLMDYLEGALRRRADAVTVISTFLKRRAIRAGVAEEKIKLIPGSADILNIRPGPKPAARSKLGLDENLHYALFFGAGQFDVGFSLDAFALVLRRFPEARFIVAGKSDEAVTRKSIEMGIQDKVIQTGWIDDGQLNDWLACADVCLLPMKDNPTNHARWPNKTVFYMAAGRPVVATGVNDIGDLIRRRNTGLVCPVDVREFAGRIINLFENPQMAEEMGRRARETAENEYAPRFQGAALEQLYLNLSGAHHG